MKRTIIALLALACLSYPADAMSPRNHRFAMQADGEIDSAACEQFLLVPRSA